MGGDDSDVETSAADDDPADEDEFHYPEVFRERVPPPDRSPRRRSVPSEGTTSTAAMGTHPWKTKRHAFACPARGGGTS